MSNWTDLTILHGNEEGARAAFERACEMVIRAKYPHQTVRGIRVKQGDAGIDVYVGKLGVSPIEVYQCKYSTDGIGDSQKNKSGTHMTLRLTPRTLMKKLVSLLSN
ncbi:hypothetical protein [Pseudomonas syringae]|uniref:hypothetical protein n=1 Tax=Pseudomonas syringae TaxID=317 RepID=UPI0011D1A89E|nr:hypothetical protein [Pseudomonas syringae]